MMNNFFALFILGCAAGCGSREAPPATEEPAPRSGGLTPADLAAAGVVGARPTKAIASRALHENLIRTPNAPDPHPAPFALEEAVAGMPTDGQLVADFQTDRGHIFCDLHADRNPQSVATFVALARGLRPYWDARAGLWTSRRYYDETTVHRVIPGNRINLGDYLGDGTGDLGFAIPREVHPTLAHDRPGRLALANVEGRISGQIYFTDGNQPELDSESGGSIIGTCVPTEIISQIAHTPQTPEGAPTSAVRIRRVVVVRHAGGASNLLSTRGALPRVQLETRADHDGHDHDEMPDNLPRIRDLVDRAQRAEPPLVHPHPEHGHTH